MLFSYIREDIYGHNKVGISLHPLLEEYYKIQHNGLEIGDSSSRNIENTDVNSFQPQFMITDWTQRSIHKNKFVEISTMPVQTRRQLCHMIQKMLVLALTVSIVEPKNIKEEMVDSAWIEAMQDELHYGYGRNKKDEDQTVIRNKARLVAKGYAQEEGIDFEESLHSYLAWKQPEGSIDPDHTEEVSLSEESFVWIKTSSKSLFLGDKLVSWMSKKQNCTAMSSAEAEYVALSVSCAQVMWMRTQLQDYGFNYNKIPLYCDSQSAIAISCNPVQHSRTKHIHTWYHFIKEQVKNGIIELYFVRTEYQLADMFMKALPKDRFKYLVRRIGMRCLTPADLEVLTNETA
ncbi:hypothetical protein Tco_0327642 [Tanacetum coccineum]